MTLIQPSWAGLHPRSAKKIQPNPTLWDSVGIEGTRAGRCCPVHAAPASPALLRHAGRAAIPELPHQTSALALNKPFLVDLTSRLWLKKTMIARSLTRLFISRCNACRGSLSRPVNTLLVLLWLSLSCHRAAAPPTLHLPCRGGRGAPNTRGNLTQPEQRSVRR